MTNLLRLAIFRTLNGSSDHDDSGFVFVILNFGELF